MRPLLLASALALGSAALVGAPVARAQPEGPSLARGAPQVHFHADDPDLILFRWPTHDEPALGPAYRDLGFPVCRAPCDQVVDGREGQVFYFGGRGLPASETFLLRDREGLVRFDVRTDASDRRRGGVVLAALGGAMTGIGLVTALFSAALEGNDPRPSPPMSPAEIGSIAVGTVGAAVLIAGVVMIRKSSAATVVREGRAAPLRVGPRLDGVTLRF